eukprot:15040402-Alexandrium_andersonii.AAC.1
MANDATCTELRNLAQLDQDHARDVDGAALSLFKRYWQDARQGGQPTNEAVLLREVSGALLRLWKLVKRPPPGEDAAARGEARAA